MLSTSATRSADADHLDFTSLPLIGLIAVARTAGEGAAKYGRFNYLKGLPAHDCLNHALRHQTLWLAGDRSEPHLEHAAWNLLAAISSLVTHPELNAPHLLGPGATLTPEVLAELDRRAPELAERRKAGEVDGAWRLADLPEVRRIIEQRSQVQGV